MTPLLNDVTELPKTSIDIKNMNGLTHLVINNPVSICDTRGDDGRHVSILSNSRLGDLSDGYHTFDELYHHRALLFMALINTNTQFDCFKSKKHSDGTMFDNMFIVGIITNAGQITYHYDIDPYWDMFNCEELPFAPEWDGHTPADVCTRLVDVFVKKGE